MDSLPSRTQSGVHERTAEVPVAQPPDLPSYTNFQRSYHNLTIHASNFVANIQMNAVFPGSFHKLMFLIDFSCTFLYAFCGLLGFFFVWNPARPVFCSASGILSPCRAQTLIPSWHSIIPLPGMLPAAGRDGFGRLRFPACFSF